MFILFKIAQKVRVKWVSHLRHMWSKVYRLLTYNRCANQWMTGQIEDKRWMLEALDEDAWCAKSVIVDEKPLLISKSTEMTERQNEMNMRDCEGSSRQRSGVRCEGRFMIFWVCWYQQLLIYGLQMMEVDIRPSGERQYDTAYIFETLPSENEMSPAWVSGSFPSPERNLIAQIRLCFFKVVHIYSFINAFVYNYQFIE